MISKSTNHNPNYLAKVVKLKGLRKHENADRLQVVTIDFQNVITNMEAKDGDIYVYFPIESAINKAFLAFTNEFRDKTLNNNTEEVGFFEQRGRVRAVKLRGEKSMGYLAPVSSLEKFTGKKIADHIGEEFDTIGDTLICQKYFVPGRRSQSVREGKKPRISRLVEGQVRLHVDTENLRRNSFMIKPTDTITVSYKVHGTSWWVSNILVNKKLGFFGKLFKKYAPKVRAYFGFADTEYDYIYGSRKVVKNQYETQNKQDYYDTDIWGDIKQEIKDVVPKGYTIYGEAVGYTSTGQAIQAKYDYGCRQGEKKLLVYRITVTNPDGVVMDLSTPQIEEFCIKYNLGFIHVFYHGLAKNIYPDIDIENHWNEEFVKRLEKDYNDKDCFICVNKVPEEGIVVRKEKFFEFEAYKLKSFRFLEHESKMLDEESVDIESEN